MKHIQLIVSVTTMFFGVAVSAVAQAQIMMEPIREMAKSDNSHAQNSANSPMILPVQSDNGYFSYNLLPDGSIDPVDYATAKTRFVSENPEGYEAMITKERGSEKVRISRSDYLNFPSQKKQEVDSRLDFYIIVD